MKVFLGEFKIFDGEHEQYRKLMARADNIEKATELFLSQEHDTRFKQPHEQLTWFDYGDGLTSAKFQTCKEINSIEASILEKHDAVHFLNK